MCNVEWKIVGGEREPRTRWELELELESESECVPLKMRTSVVFNTKSRPAIRLINLRSNYHRILARGFESRFRATVDGLGWFTTPSALPNYCCCTIET